MPESRPTVAPPGAVLARPELLAPAGDWECARAAVENGADAIYFGLDRFNARMRANNFTEADLPPLMEFLHRRGVRGYVTLNTLVFEDELAGAEQYLRTMMAAGVDAVIVQDVGLCRMIRQLSPDFPIHASTQMTITSAAGVEFARDLGCQLVVLARELSIQDIGHIQSAFHPPDTALPAPRSPLPLEVFVHGALCVAYSGQCLTSESLGGRSANRGECAQACRMPYELVSDGRVVPLGDRRYLLSPQDLAGLEVLSDLARVGVASLKIEGRLKSPEYVANITRIYRKALDELGTGNAQRGVQALPGPQACSPRSPLPAPRYEMEMAFSRGLYTGWFGGINNQELVHARFGKKRGVYLGLVTGVERDRVWVRLEGPLKPGDGVVFDAGHPEELEEGGRVFEVRSLKSEVRRGESELTFGNNAINFSRVRVGDRLWKTSDPALERQWRQSFEGDSPKFQRPLSMEVHGRVRQPLTLIARDEDGHVARAESSMPLAAAEKQALTPERLRDQLGRLGGTPFRLGTLLHHLDENLILPVSELNRLRRQVVTELDRLRAQPRRWTVNASPVAPRAAPPPEASTRAQPGAAELVVLVRNLAQLETALRCGLQTVYCDFENPKSTATPSPPSAPGNSRPKAAANHPPAPLPPLPAPRSTSPHRASSSRARNGSWSRCGPARLTAISCATMITCGSSRASGASATSR